MENILQDFKERIVAAGAERKPLRIVGSGSKDWYGNALRGEPLHTRAYTGIISYDPTELVITARCGTPLAEIDAVLSAQNQMLAFEPPHFGVEATIGGMLACGLSGPRRAAVGAVRDFVLGAVLMNGKGEVLHFGGQVMKNVAGYDVSRLLAGSLGMLGLVLEMSIKVLPRPVAESTLRLHMTQADAIDTLNKWGGQALPISASVWQDGVLLVRLSGAAAAVDAAVKRLGGELVPDADLLWSDVREQRSDFFKSDLPLWRLSLPSITPPLTLPGTPLIEWGGAQRWLHTDLDASAIRDAAQAVGGHATLFRGGDNCAGDTPRSVFHPLAPAVLRFHRNLKDAFDPDRVFNPGRMLEEL